MWIENIQKNSCYVLMWVKNNDNIIIVLLCHFFFQTTIVQSSVTIPWSSSFYYAIWTFCTDLASLPHLDWILQPSLYWSITPTSILIINRQYKSTHHWWQKGKEMGRWRSEDSRQQIWRMNKYRNLMPNVRTNKIVLHVGFMQNE